MLIKSSYEHSFLSPVINNPVVVVPNIGGLSDVDAESFREQCAQLGVDADVLINYAAENGLSLADVMNAVDTQRTNRAIAIQATITGSSVMSVQPAMQAIAPAAGTTDTTTDDGLKPYITPTYSVDLTNDNSYDPGTGSFTHKEVDAVIPGRNGLDLVIGRIYNSYDDLTYTSSAMITTPNSQKQLIYGLGGGWQFMFSSVENYFGIYLHMSDGATYAYDASSASGLKDHKQKDLYFVVNGSTAAPSSYDLYHSDGKVEHFGSNGLLLSITDKYGNAITFQNSGRLISNGYSLTEPYWSPDYTTIITDSLGQTTTITRTRVGNGVAGTDNGIITITLPGDSTIPGGNRLTYTTFVPALPDKPNNFRQESFNESHQYELKSFQDQSGNITTYHYQSVYEGYNYLNNLAARDYTLAYTLDQVMYPTPYTNPDPSNIIDKDNQPISNETISFFSYPFKVKVNSGSGFRDKYFLTYMSASIDSVNHTHGNLQMFSIPDFTGYYYTNGGQGSIAHSFPYGPGNLPSTYTYNNTVQTRLNNSNHDGADTSADTGNYTFNYYTMNSKSLVTDETTMDGKSSKDTDTTRTVYLEGKKLNEVQTTFDVNYFTLPATVTTIDYNSNGADHLDRVEKYEYL